MPKRVYNQTFFEKMSMILLGHYIFMKSIEALVYGRFWVSFGTV